MEAATPSPSASNSAYSHDPLDPNKQQIRLVRLNDIKAAEHQAASSTTPSFEITVFDLDTAPEYSALSYMWGIKHYICPILLNGHDYLISPNLHAFLLWMIQHKVNSWIWIDQISINQDLITERNHQVSMMAAIYSQASQVIIWLGKGLDGASNLFLNRARSVKHRPDCWIPCCDCLHYGSLPGEVVASIDLLIKNEYWHRVWVMQEIFLGRVLSLACDLGYGQFNILAFISEDHWDPRRLSIRPLFYGLKYFREKVCGFEKPTDSWDLLIAASFRDCQDPRDRVFALQGILEPQQRLASIDYDKGVEEVFLEATSVAVA